MLIQSLIISLIFNAIGFFLGYSFRSDKFTDISYALTFAVIVIAGLLSSNMSPVQWLVTILILLWAYRIGSYLLMRIRFMGRDKRFDDKRDDFVKFGSFWILQALTVWLVLFPASLLYGLEGETKITFVAIAGACVSIIGLLIEAVADRQKFNFIKDDKNKYKWIQSGLWKFSRHPNYFGEILMWVGVYIVSVEWLGQTSRYLAIVGPATIIFMLLFVSGVPLLEKSAEKKWGKNKEYVAYRDRTSILIPMLPKKK